jgi:hypothetical protein
VVVPAEVGVAERVVLVALEPAAPELAVRAQAAEPLALPAERAHHPEQEPGAAADRAAPAVASNIPSAVARACRAHQECETNGRPVNCGQQCIRAAHASRMRGNGANRMVIPLDVEPSKKPRSLIMRAGVEAARWFKEREFREVHGLVTGQILFGLGWSLTWACALALITFVPIILGPILMAAGLCFPAIQRWRRNARSAAIEGTTALKQPAAARAADRPL